MLPGPDQPLPSLPGLPALADSLGREARALRRAAEIEAEATAGASAETLLKEAGFANRYEGMDRGHAAETGEGCQGDQATPDIQDQIDRLDRRRALSPAGDRFSVHAVAAAHLEAVRSLQGLVSSIETAMEDSVDASEEALLAGALDRVIEEAIACRASDIHLQIRAERGDYGSQRCWIRFRIDGDLQFRHFLTGAAGERLVIAAKTRAGLDVSDRATACRGSFSFEEHGRWLEIRVSCAPDMGGQKMVLRLLDLGATYPLEAYYAHAPWVMTVVAPVLRRSSKRGAGILLCGPTSQGKTSAAYSMLGFADRAHRSIYTIGELIEHHLKYATQIEIQPLDGRRFSDVASQIVTLDPDIVHFEELNSSETAASFLRIADTGHLVMATTHADRCPDGLERTLVLMPQEDVSAACHVLARTVEAVVNQRLVKLPCPVCSRTIPVEEALSRNESGSGLDLRWILRDYPGSFAAGHPVRDVHPEGCPECGHSGYRGRTVLAEILWPTDEAACRGAMQEAMRRGDFHAIPRIPGMRYVTFTSAAVKLFADGVTDLRAVAEFMSRSDTGYSGAGDWLCPPGHRGPTGHRGPPGHRATGEGSP